MKEDRRDAQRRQRDGELVLQTPTAFIKRESNLLEVLERRSQPRRRQDVKKRLVDQWKQTLALSSMTARKLVVDPAPAPTPRRAPPKPPKPKRDAGRTTVNRIRKEPLSEVVPKPIVQTAPEPIVQAAPEPIVRTAPEPVVKTAPEPVVKTAPEPIVKTAPPKRPPRPSRWLPSPRSLRQRLTEVAVQTAGTVLLTLAMKASSALAAIEDRSPFGLI